MTPALQQPGGREAAVKRDVQTKHPGRSTIRMIYTEGCSSEAGHARSWERTRVQKGQGAHPNPPGSGLVPGAAHPSPRGFASPRRSSLEGSVREARSNEKKTTGFWVLLFF